MSNVERDIGAILARLDDLEERQNKTDARLDKGAQRFNDADKQEAAEKAVRTLMLWAGGAVLSLIGTVGLWALSYVPALVRWWISISPGSK